MFIQKIVNVYNKPNYIHFSGYTKRFHLIDKNYKPVSIDNIKNSSDTYIEKGGIERIIPRKDPLAVTIDVYYAEPGEEITDDIRNRHNYIVKYTEMPDNIAYDDIENSLDDKERLSGIIQKLSLLQRLFKAKLNFISNDSEKLYRQLRQKYKEYEKIKIQCENKSFEMAKAEQGLQDTEQKLKIANKLLKETDN